jgi:hypothetical protein
MIINLASLGQRAPGVTKIAYKNKLIDLTRFLPPVTEHLELAFLHHIFATPVLQAQGIRQIAEKLELPASTADRVISTIAFVSDFPPQELQKLILADEMLLNDITTTLRNVINIDRRLLAIPEIKEFHDTILTLVNPLETLSNNLIHYSLLNHDLVADFDARVQNILAMDADQLEQFIELLKEVTIPDTLIPPFTAAGTIPEWIKNLFKRLKALVASSLSELKKLVARKPDAQEKSNRLDQLATDFTNRTAGPEKRLTELLSKEKELRQKLDTPGITQEEKTEIMEQLGTIQAEISENNRIIYNATIDFLIKGIDIADLTPQEKQALYKRIFTFIRRNWFNIALAGGLVGHLAWDYFRDTISAKERIDAKTATITSMENLIKQKESELLLATAAREAAKVKDLTDQINALREAQTLIKEERLNELFEPWKVFREVLTIAGVAIAGITLLGLAGSALQAIAEKRRTAVTPAPAIPAEAVGIRPVRRRR